MPIALKFLHTNPSPRLHIEEGVEASSLWFDSTSERLSESRACFKIFCLEGDYDVYSLKGKAIIRPVASKNESQQSSFPDPNDTCGIERKPDCLVIAWPPSDSKGTDKFQPFFDRYLALPTNTFQRVLQANPETRLVHLWIDTAISLEGGLVYGNNYDHNEIEWRVEKRTMLM